MKARSPVSYAILLLLATMACKKDPGDILLQAITGPDASAAIGDTVWLDASASIGDAYDIQWRIRNQPGDDSISNANSDSAYFIPFYNGLYQLELTISQDQLSSRDYQDIQVSGAVKLPDQILQSTRLFDIAQDNEPDYFASGPVEVLDRLVIDPGVVIEFYPGASLVVRNGGSIYAQSASFVAADSSWQGIELNTERNTFANCTIDRAGNASFTGDESNKTAVLARGSATLAFSGNTLSNSLGYGITVLDEAEFFQDNDNAVLSFRNNKFLNNTLGPMFVPVHTLGDLPGQFFEGDTADRYIEIYASEYGSERSKKPQFVDMGLPYKITGLLTFRQDLAVLKGVQVHFDDDAGLWINGKLTVTGAEDEAVLFDALNTEHGWMGISVSNGQADFLHATIRGAGNLVFGGLSMPASLTVKELLSMKHCRIIDGQGIGLHMPGTAHIQFEENFTGNTIEGHAGAAVRIRMDDVNKVVNGNQIRAGSADIPAVAIHAAGDDPLGTWPDLDNEYDYQFVESLTLKSTKNLIIEAGASIRINPGLTWTISGGCQVGDSAGLAVMIRGSEARKGLWDGILLNGNGPVLFQNADIRHGGGAMLDKANVIVDANASDVTIRNSRITLSKGYGVLIKAGASDFGINDPGAGNTLEGDLGGFHTESK